MPTEIRGSMEMIEGSPRWGVKQEDSENIAMYYVRSGNKFIDKG
jgi:hypothetical protein